MAKTNKNIAIVGGGILGLVLAYRLSKAGQTVTLIEKAPQLGGLASGLQQNGYSIEKYYHHWFKSDTSIQNLIAELGLGDRLIWPKSLSGIFAKGQLNSSSKPLDLFKLKGLSLIDKFRLSIVSAYLQKIASYASVAGVTALDWCNKWYGVGVTNYIWRPLIEGKFGKYANQVTMTWLLARIKDRASSRPSPLGYEYLGYLNGGFQLLIDKLEEACKQHGVTIFTSANISSYSNVQSEHKLKWAVGDDVQNQTFDLVVGAVPGPAFLSIFGSSADIDGKIADIQYLGATCMLLSLKQSITPYYWLSVADQGFPFMAVIEHTNFMPKEAYNGEHLVYIAKYLDVADDLYAKNADELLKIYEPFLQKINPNYSNDWVTGVQLFKGAFAQHVVTPNYRIPTYETAIPGLYFANFCQITPHDRGTNYAVEQADELARMIMVH